MGARCNILQPKDNRILSSCFPEFESLTSPTRRCCAPAASCRGRPGRRHYTVRQQLHSSFGGHPLGWWALPRPYWAGPPHQLPRWVQSFPCQARPDSNGRILSRLPARLQTILQAGGVVRGVGVCTPTVTPGVSMLPALGSPAPPVVVMQVSLWCRGGVVNRTRHSPLYPSRVIMHCLAAI